MPSRDTYCGLCGKQGGPLAKTECCGQTICDDYGNYVAFSYSRDSCRRNHDRYTLCMFHKNECKGLIVQIRYLKAKFTREALLRSDLGFQKRYLLALLARCERTENKILAVIATIGYPPAEPPAPPPPKKRSLKSVVISVLFLGRVR